MRQISIYEAPIEINGLLSDYHKGHLWKMPEELWGKVSDWIDMMGIRATGGRVRFRTNSKKLYLRSTLQSCTSDTNFTIVGSAACDVIRGRGVRDAEYIGLVVPPAFGTLVGERTIELPGTMEDYTIYYGSSITEGCTATHPSCNFVAYTARWVDADFVNFGFSGSAFGEPKMAEFITKQNMSVFVYDYDHNAECADDLRRTHEPFFRTVREAHPDLPIIMISKADPWHQYEMLERRDIIRRTYRNAIADGDKNVYFIDGSKTYGEDGRFACTSDMLHPNDIGYRLMSERLYPVLRHALETRYGKRADV